MYALLLSGMAPVSVLLRPWREHRLLLHNLIDPACALREQRNEAGVVPPLLDQWF